MSGAAETRREARRRRILENSNDRLQRIAGKNATLIERRHEVSPVSETLEVQNLVMEPCGPSFTDESSSIHSLLQTSAIEQHPLQNNSAEPQLTAFFNSLTSLPLNEEVEASPPTVLEKVIAAKLDVIICSVLVQVLYSILGLSQNVLLPIVIHEITKTWLFSTRQQGGMVSALLLINGIPPDNVNKLVHIVHSVKTILQDLCIYLFATVCMQSIYLTFLTIKP